MNRRGEALRSVGIWLLVLGFLMFAGGIPASNAQDITTDPFVQQELDRSNWEPGGARFPGTFFVRGPIVLRGGTVVVSPLPEQQLGSFVLQQGVVLGQYTYTIDLAAPHGFTVHSPFDITTAASDSASLKTPTQEIDVFLSWDAFLRHPADGYDPPTGGGFPPATGARDEFTFDITGNVSGLFFVATPNGAPFAAAQPPFVPTSSSPFSVNGTVSGGGQLGGGPQQSAVTPQGIQRQASINPNSTYELNAARFGVAQTTPQTTEVSVIPPSSVLTELGQWAVNVAIEEGVQQVLEIGFDNPAWQLLAKDLHGLEALSDFLGVASVIITVVELAVETIDVLTATNADEYADAVSDFTRIALIAFAAKVGGLFGVFIGGGPLGGLIGASVGAATVWLGYDAFAADLVKEAASAYYRNVLQ